MKVGDICRNQVVTVTPRTDLVAAAEVMREKHVGFLIVVEPAAPGSTGFPAYGQPVGVLTDRDIVVSVVARGADASQLVVEDCMSRRPSTIEESEPVDHALQAMRQLGVRRMPVVTSQGMLTGVLSLDDVLEVLAGELGDISRAVRNEQRIEDRLRP